MNRKDEYNSNISIFSFMDAIPCLGDYELYFKHICSSDSKIILSLISFLEYNEVINLKRTCKSIYKKLDKKIVTKFVRNGGITNITRKSFWINNIDYVGIERLIRKELNQTSIDENLYKKILELAEIENKNIDKKFFKVTEEIHRDLDRTFHIDKFQTLEGQMELGRVLIALAYVRPEIGYCQGMNFVAGALLNFLIEEELVFWVFLSLLDDKELNSLYFKNMPDYSIRIYQLNYFIKKHLPELFYHFKKKQINPDIFFSKWILTIFSSYLPFSTLSKVWDIFLIDKWKAIFKFSLAFLNELRNILITMDLNKLSIYFRDNARNLHSNFNVVLMNYKKFKVTNSELQILRESFFIDQIKRKIEDPDSNWENDQTEALNNYKTEVEHFDKESKKEIMIIQQKLQNSNKDHQFSYESYLLQLKNCSDLKNKIEELVESKAAYENVINLLKLDIKSTTSPNNTNENVKNNLNDKLNNIENNYSQKHTAPEKTHHNIYQEHKQKSKGDKKYSKISHRSAQQEIKKISKKLKKVDKELLKTNKGMLENYKILDEKKFQMEKLLEEKERCKINLEQKMFEYESKKKEMMKILTEKLRLSEKFVKTSQF